MFHRTQVIFHAARRRPCGLLSVLVKGIQYFASHVEENLKAGIIRIRN